MSGCLKSKNVSVTHFILTVDYVRTIDLQQACFFNVWPPSGANKFAEILSLEANFLSLVGKSFSLLKYLSILGVKLYSFGERLLSLAKYP